MLQSLQDLRLLTRRWLYDEAGQEWDDPHADWIINQAYQDVVNSVDRLPEPWSEADAPLTITPITGQREYDLGTPRTIRGVVEVREQINDNDREKVTIVQWARRFERASGGVYVYRTSGGQWRLGTVVLDHFTRDLLVWTRPTVARLQDPGAFPDAVPESFHELIALKAAILGKVSQNREAGDLAGLYTEKMAQLEAMGPAMHSLNESRRLGR